MEYNKMSILKDTIAFYKEQKRKEKEKRILLNSITNIGMLEEIIQRCNDNPNLKVVIYMRDSTRYELSTYQYKSKPAYTQINGIEEIR